MAERFRNNGQLMWLETCYKCKTPFAISNAVYVVAKERCEDFTWYCPYGHPQHYVRGESDLQKERRARQRVEQQLAQKNDEIRWEQERTEAARRQTAAQKGQVTRLKTRAKAGLCPCCNRSFQNLRRHIENKHPDFEPKDDEAATNAGRAA